jgi:hypothetical protein
MRLPPVCKDEKQRCRAAATTQKKEKTEAENRLNTPPSCRSHAGEYAEALPHASDGRIQRRNIAGMKLVVKPKTYTYAAPR